MDDIFEGGNTVPHENVYSLPEKQTCKKTLEIRKFIVENFWTTRKSFKFQEKIALLFVLEKNVGKALIYIEDLR